MPSAPSVDTATPDPELRWRRLDQRVRDLCARGHWAAAVTFAREAVLVARRWNDYRFARSLQALATVAAEAGDDATRWRCLTAASSWYAKHGFCSSRDGIALQLHLAIASLEQGDVDEAESICLRALALAGRKLQRADWLYTSLVLTLARALDLQGKLSLASQVRHHASVRG